jgi:hypothetical protein
MIAKQNPRLMLTGMAKLAHESSTFVNHKELQRVKKKGSTQGLLDAFATPRTSRTSQNSPYDSGGPSQGSVEGNMGFQYPDEADAKYMAEVDASCSGFSERLLVEPEVKIKALRKTLTWAAGVIKDQIKEKTEMRNDKFLQSNDKGDVWSSEKPQWTQVGSAIRFGEQDPQSYAQFSTTSMDDFRLKLDDAHDSLFYTATGLNDFTNESRLDVNILGALYGEPMARKILQEKESITRPEVREMLMYLLYFGIGGKSNSCASHMKYHLNGRKTKEQRDSSLNHFVTGDKVVRTCVFKLDFSHYPSKAEQMGIDFVTETKKQTNIRESSAHSDALAERMYYYMILVLDPDFSAKEIRTAKNLNCSRGNKNIASQRKSGGKRKLQQMQGLSKGAITRNF